MRSVPAGATVGAECVTMAKPWREVAKMLIMKLAVRVFIALLLILLIVSICEEGVRIYRAKTNAAGTNVDGYGLWERQIESKRMKNAMPDLFKGSNPKWDLQEFYQYQAMCEWDSSRKNKWWQREKKRLLTVKMNSTDDSPLLYDPGELPEQKYVCARTEMFYQSGMGWGLF